MKTNMNTADILHVLDHEALPDTCENADYVETINSWVIRSDHHAFKIRKPQQSSGRDMSKMEDRKKACLKELELNKSLASDVYQEVIPVKKVRNSAENSEGEGNEVVDYALKMKRLQESNKLLYQLEKQTITKKTLKQVANQIAGFHQNTQIIKNALTSSLLLDKVEELRRCNTFLNELFGHQYLIKSAAIIEAVNEFITKNRYQFQERVISGFVRDVHGNLSAENIFIQESPIIIDRVVLNDDVRVMDVLSDLSRLGTDFDFYNLPSQGELLFQHYLKKMGMELTPFIKQLYTFYKLYEISLLITKNIDEITVFDISDEEKSRISRYFKLADSYLYGLELAAFH